MYEVFEFMNGFGIASKIGSIFPFKQFGFYYRTFLPALWKYSLFYMNLSQDSKNDISS